MTDKSTPQSLARDLMLRHTFCFPDDMAAVEVSLRRRMDAEDSLVVASFQRLEFEIVETIKAALAEQANG